MNGARFDSHHCPVYRYSKGASHALPWNLATRRLSTLGATRRKRFTRFADAFVRGAAASARDRAIDAARHAHAARDQPIAIAGSQSRALVAGAHNGARRDVPAF